MQKWTTAAVATVGTAAIVAATLIAVNPGGGTTPCPPGTVRVGDAEQPVSPERLRSLAPEYRGGGEIEYGRELRDGCIPRTGPESFTELALRDAQLSSVRLAPLGEVRNGAALAAAQERDAIVQQAPSVPGLGGTARKYGVGPINSNDERFPEVNNQGFVDNTGRIDDFTYHAATNRLFAAIGTGGVWLSEDRGATFRPITDNLPSTVVSSVAYTEAGGPDGTVVVVTGEHTFGGFAFVGIGTWYSRDLGETWQRSQGPPSDTLGFAAEVDPTDPNVVYAATGNGLWRSTDAGATFTDVVLPTGDCAGDYNDQTCNFANFVTDVIVQAPGGSTDAEGGRVVAAVGWRAGQQEGHDGEPQSPNNGIYRSDTGEPGTFERLDSLEAAIPDGGAERIGRIELGPAIGPAQDHDVLYAIVEDAVLFQGGGAYQFLPGDADPTGLVGLALSVLSGVYVSTDLGDSWTLLAEDNELANSCPANASAFCIPGVITPGVQAWYNLWVHPDPTVQDPRGIPTRLLFGLEEVWQSREPGVPTDSPATSFEVIGRYYADGACLVGECTVNRPADTFTTTHPDQHSAIFLPEVDDDGAQTGTVDLLVGHDGGLSRQTSTGPADPFDQNSWQLEQTNGLQTLLPYQAAIANDGVAYQGLQDNGHVKIIPEDGFQQFGTIGADGTDASVDPENSDYAWESIQGGLMNVTTDGGTTWQSATPPADNKLFVNPSAMDPLDPNHLVTGGTQINETLAGPDTATQGWLTVFDLEDSTAPQPDGVDPPPNQQTAITTRGPGTYVGFCGVCDILNSESPFRNGLATNVSADDSRPLPNPGTSDGWHFASADGLPNRYITSVAIDPFDETLRTIYVTLGGYSREWVPPGATDDDNANVGEGHIFKSTDAGETFTDISGNLPDINVNWVTPRGDQLLVGTDHGLYLSSDTAGGNYAVVAPDVLPNAPVMDIDLKADDPDFALIAYYGRGLWAYEFPDGDFDVARHAGPTRIQTAVEVSRATHDSSDTVVLARSDEYADALAGAPLGAREQAPILLTPSGGLHPDVAAEVERLGATRAILLGGGVALSAQVVDDLRAAGVTDLERFGDTNRYGTARAIALELGGREVYVTEGDDPDPRRGWPDAMSIAPVAAAQQRPILLVTTEALPGETRDALRRLDANAATIVGGPAAVSAPVAEALRADVTVRDRIAGRNRFETSVAAARVGLQAGLTVQDLFLARGGDFPDALAAGPSVAGAGGSLVLVPDGNLENAPSSSSFIDTHACAVDDLHILGGTRAIAKRVRDQAVALFGDCTAKGPGTPPTPAPLGQGAPEPAGETLAGPFGFEDGAQGWTVETDGNPASAWAQGDQGHESSAGFELRPYLDNTDSSLVSPEIDHPGGRVFVSWFDARATETGFDGYSLEWSVDGGEWAEVTSLDGQNEDHPDFTQQQVSFEAPGGTLQVRFHFTSDAFCSSGTEAVCGSSFDLEGVTVDDVLVQQ